MGGAVWKASHCSWLGFQISVLVYGSGGLDLDTAPCVGRLSFAPLPLNACRHR
ncbi:hypothetical protein PF005_g11974 [Phytophthora fragariae]|uniref:Uncharacterized protein n=1 Tax=Phytophthora fragariae TaxID=53985 RepID=A0A6A4DUT8_9STRA|nr:hypothetical protein PF003_g20822 [Phytophthora fragariae]KAE8945992.1 hypothetical protein PF009_g4375 [Phytophthora fragariae]KAE9013319.1 hypothetical protein PF011_g8531 [Phytophthora fragariae]KAE9109490.1 hypothetical protein PF007_g12221 [Phytophthora fragariae]KAE9111161.1 hypothetical protein PF010_g10909 [Phytophthora fragariae]